MTDLSELPPPSSLTDDQVVRMRADLVARIGAAPADRSRARRRWGWASGGVLTGAAAIAVGVAFFTPQAAYASWTASPSALGQAQTQSLGTACAGRVHERFRTSSAQLRPVVAERRGDFVTMLIADRGQISLCADWFGPLVDGVQRGSTFEALTMDAALPAGQAVSVAGVPGQLSGPDAVRMAYGLVSPSVAKVVVATADGRTVTASVGQGYFLAWWPSGAEIKTVTALDIVGETVGQAPEVATLSR